jgi:integrase
MTKLKDTTFNKVADVHLEMITKKTSGKDREYISKLRPFIGGIYMSDLIRPKELGVPKHALNKYVLKRSKDNVTANTVNKELSILNTIGRKAVREYDLISNKCWENVRLLDESEENRLKFQPSKIKSHLEPEWEAELLNLMPPLTRDMAKFSIHTGQRESIVCNLRWDWFHTDIWDDGEISYFRVPKNLTKSSRHIQEDVFIVLNEVALFSVLKYRHNNSAYVFTESGDPIGKINNSSYQTARMRASLVYRDIANTDVHSFKRTFVTRLTEADVPYVWVQRLANHKLSSVTEKYVKMSAVNRKVAWNYLRRIVTKGDRHEINQQNKEGNEEHK